MKRFFTTSLIVLFSITLYAQPWMELLPPEKIESGKLTFFDYQNAFNDYWGPKNVVNGYYIDDKGEKAKAGGWKQFKRWEWYWENRVNPTTGEFPSTSAFEELKKIQQQTNQARSTSGQWTSMGPSSSTGGYAGIGRLNCIGFHPTDNNTYYVGAASGGVWKTTDGGSNWIVQANELDAIGVSDIVVHETTGDDIVYIATGDRDASDTYSVGIMKSTDGGTTWSATGLTYTAGQKKLVNRLLNDPTNNSIFYAATSNGLYKSTDDCANWTQINGTVFMDLEFKPGVSSTIYASSKQGDIYKSTDSGSTWSTVLSTSGKRTELAVSANDATVVYALIAASNSGLFGIYKSTDSGSSFSQTYNSPNLLGWSCSGGDSGGQGWYDLCIAADPNNATTVFIGGVNNWKSTDGGTTWNINNHWSSTCGGQATNVHADKHNLAFQNGSSTLFECNDGGLYVTTDGGNSWTDQTNGMVISQLYKLGVAQTTTADVIGGLQDNGTKALLTNTWNDVIGGDGMECLIDWSNENTQYGSLYYGRIFRTTNHWASSTEISGSLGNTGAWVTPYIQDPTNSNTIYAGYSDVWKSTDQGNNWTQISSWGGSTLRSITVAPSDNNYIYTATTGTLYKTSNGGSSWSNITGSLPTGSSNITYISVKDGDPNTIWVSMGEFNTHGVYESTDGGSSWTNISTGLPQLPVNCVIQNKQNSTDVELYAGTDVGVYLKLGTADWVQFSGGLPNVVVTELDIYYDNSNPSNSLIRASTYGRGLWESDLYSATNTLEANFSASSTSIEVGEQVTYTDLSTGNPTSWNWSFEGGNPPNHTGQTPPAIQYDTEGTYDVTLIVSDGTDTDTTTKEDYITVTNCTVTTFPFNEDFENGGAIPVCWSQEYISGDNVDWQFITGNGGNNPGSAHSGTYNASFQDQDTGEDKTILVTPPLDLSTFTSAQVSFWHTQEFWSPDQDELRVYYKDSENGSWNLLAEYLGSIANWTKDSIDLTNLSSTYYIGFEGNALYGYGICLDDVEVTGSTDVLTADFEGDPTSGVAPLFVNFTDLSYGGTVDTWEWDFGDGNTSSNQNPSNEYFDPGLYDVTLIVSGPSGSDTLTEIGYIDVQYPPPVADFEGFPTSGNIPLIVDFTDLSTGDIDTWEWDFGDGNTSTDQNPQHTYSSAGLFTVSLIVNGPGGADTATFEDYIFTTIEAPVAEFEGSPTMGEAPLLVTFTDLSTGDIDTYKWYFGDGDSSDIQNPQHEYQFPGNFTVTLEVSGPGGTGTEVKIDYILIPVGINNDESEAILVYPNPTTETINIVFPSTADRELKLISLSGELVFSKKTTGSKESIEVSDLPSGIYNLEIQDDSTVSSVKIVKK